MRIIVVITDVDQHQESDGDGFAHFNLEQVKNDLEGFAVVHAIAPNYGCYNTAAFDCACNETAGVCDEDCACDLKCRTPGCSADESDECDDAEETCDRDCAGFPSGVACDTTVGRCDPDPDDSDKACADDVDCAGGVQLGELGVRRCDPSDRSPFADVGELALATGGAFTTFPSTGNVDLTRLPLSGVIVRTERCDAELPEDAESVRCVYSDADGHQGEVTVALY